LGRPDLDPADRVIVEALRDNARATYAELGRLVGLSPPAVHDRVRRLEETGVLAGYHAAIGPAALGLGVSALVSVYQSDSAEQEEVAERLRGVPEIEDCWVVAGDEEFVLRVRMRDVDALELVLAVIRRIPGVARTRTRVVLSTRWEGRIAVPGPAAGAPDAGA
jgi:Lrp/AsnC family leucine-responsive transcriptional regulator